MRIIAHMVVGPGEAGRYLDKVLDRAARWVDDVHIVLDPMVTAAEIRIADKYADDCVILQDPWTDHEGRFRQGAWSVMEGLMMPELGDVILLLDADEVIFDPEPVRQIAINNPGKRLGFTFHEMWSPSEYRTDGHWKPYVGNILIPWRPGGQFRDRRIACGREPTYATGIPAVGTPVASLLHYGYAREEDRNLKYERYMELDGGRFHSLDHLRSIITRPQLAEWTKGGLI